MPETDDKVTIEKIPIDVVVRGTFIDFGRMLEQLGRSQYRLTVSDIVMDGENNNRNQDIQFISYAYFKSSDDDQSVNLASWKPPVNEEIASNVEDQMGGIATIPWRGEEVIVGIDDPQ